MQIDTCLITAAGFGTRMGELGKELPKPIWPIGDKTLLDLQVSYARDLGIKKIYINVHHQADIIEKWSKDKDVYLLKEEEILGSGGCVHNLKRVSGATGDLLIINSDQFYFFDYNCIDQAVEKMKTDNSIAHLFAINVNKNEKYNETVVTNGKLTEIKKTNGNGDFLTYSGVGIVNLDKLIDVEGNSGFFSSVCDFKNSSVQMSLPSNCEFWDFGTLDKYFDKIFELAINPSKKVKEFLNSSNCHIKVDKENNLSFEKFGMKLVRENGQRIITYKDKTILL